MNRITLDFDRPRLERLKDALSKAKSTGRDVVEFEGMKLRDKTCIYLMHFLTDMLTSHRPGQECRHPKSLCKAGPRIQARWGSFPTQVCACGAWKTVGHKAKWKTEPIPQWEEDDEA